MCPFGVGINGYDNAELAAFKSVFGTRKDIPAMAIKGAMGNNGAGAGSIDLAAMVMASSTAASDAVICRVADSSANRTVWQLSSS